MAEAEAQKLLLGQFTCSTLLQELQKIWDEVGESDEERDRMLLQLEQECLDLYTRKVDLAVKGRANLLRTLADARVELTNLQSALGEKTYGEIHEKTPGTIKEQLAAISPTLEKLWKQKNERISQFSNVQSQTQKINSEISGSTDSVLGPIFDDSDLSLNKFDIFHAQLQELQEEKNNRLHKVHEFVSTVHDLCAVLGLDFLNTIAEVHPSLNGRTGFQTKSISDDTLSRLNKTVSTLNEEKKQRLNKLQDLATQLTDLWNLMDTSLEERSLLDNVTCNISASVDEVVTPGALAFELIELAKVEVDRLDQLKASRMKEITFKRQSELEEIYAHAHIEIDTEAARDKLLSVIDSGSIEPTELLTDMDNQILRAKEEAFSRKEILDKVEKWMSACEEEIWLDDYNRDDNRYNASRGAHLNLKRAEKARVLVNKIPALVETLVFKTRSWEQDHGIAFIYEGVPLLTMLNKYILLRQDREEEKKRVRDQKMFHEQMNKEQETIFCSAFTPTKHISIKKVFGPRTNGNNSTRKLSLQNGRRDSRPAAP